ncbi:TPA: flavodoxin family protein [Candidatus Sumerlaeota bacterium]|nr:flavodoxin family protein [Candidatus Sumerlaeota bacterium]
MKVVAFNGSPRKDGNTARLIQHVFDELQKEGIETELVHIGGKPVQGCIACFGCREQAVPRCVIDDGFINPCIEKMLEADGIMLGSPTYFADITPEMKALIDRAGFALQGNLRRKVGAAVVAARRGGAMHAFHSLNNFFLIKQMIIPGSCYWNFAFGRDKGEVENDEEGIRIMHVLGENMAWLLKQTHTQK